MMETNDIKKRDGEDVVVNNDLADLLLTPPSPGGEIPSSKSSTADEVSSIEALNWSDLDDDERDYAGNIMVDSALLQSIHSSSDGSGSSRKTSQELDDGHGNDCGDEMVKTMTETLERNFDEQLKQKHGMKRKREESPMMASTISVASVETTTGDLSSNAAVLDDGPIWAKGSKKYRFEENRRMNQKLTFGVVLTVVLAVGLGLGNLVAYNECEAEHKSDIPCQMATKNVLKPSTAIPPPPSAAPAPPSEKVIPGTPTSAATRTQEPEVIPLFIPPPVPDTMKATKPMIDPKYAQHAEQLRKVLKKLDELSRKIDKFENTTRQLGGIVMMNDDIPNEGGPTKKSKFIKLLAEFMETKKLKNKGEVKDYKTLKDKKEEVLDEIAGAVLEAMRDEYGESDLETETIVVAENQDDEAIVSEEEDPVVSDLDEKISEVVKKLEETPPPSVLIEKILPPLEKVQKNPSKNYEDLPVLPSKKKRSVPNKLADAKEENPKNTKINQKKSKFENRTKKLKRQAAFDNSDDEIIKPKIKNEKKKQDGKQKYEKKQGNTKSKENGNRNKKNKQKNDKLKDKPDWQSMRALERDASRKREDAKEKMKNWQLERDKVREHFRSQRASSLDGY